MRSEGYGTWFVCVCVCLSTLTLSLQAMSGTNVQLKRTKGSKNNVPDFAETSAFELERETGTARDDPTHQLVVCACTCALSLDWSMHIIYIIPHSLRP